MAFLYHDEGGFSILPQSGYLQYQKTVLKLLMERKEAEIMPHIIILIQLMVFGIERHN